MRERTLAKLSSQPWSYALDYIKHVAFEARLENLREDRPIPSAAAVRLVNASTLSDEKDLGYV